MDSTRNGSKQQDHIVYTALSKSLFDEDEDNELRTVVNACFHLVRNDYKDTLGETDIVMQTLITLLMVSCSTLIFLN